jgi:hypothetical protein
MEQTYYIFSLKLNAWLGRSVYTSDYESAREFPRDEALRRCREAVLNDGGKLSPVLIMVSTADINSVTA